MSTMKKNPIYSYNFRLYGNDQRDKQIYDYLTDNCRFKGDIRDLLIAGLLTVINGDGYSQSPIRTPVKTAEHTQERQKAVEPKVVPAAIERPVDPIQRAYTEPVEVPEPEPIIEPEPVEDTEFLKNKILNLFG